MDLQQMESQVFNVLRDTARSFFDKEEIDAWLNEAALDLATRLELLQHEWTGTTSDENITLPDELIRITRLRLGAKNVSFVDDDVWWQESDNAAADTERPIARVFSGQIEVYPSPTTSTAYVLRGTRTPDALVDPEDAPDLPLQLHRKLIDYARYQALLKDGSDRWQPYAAEYERGLPEVPTGIVKLQPGPFLAALAPGPFDLDPQATHI